MSLGPRLWDGFHPEDDPVEPYSKEEYRGWFRDFFKCQIQRSDDLDKKFFDGFAQMGADPLHWVEQFKADAQLRTWKEVIHCLGEICLKVTNPNVSYNRKLMGSLSDHFWERVKRRPGGPALLRAIKNQPGEKKGLAHIKTAFYILGFKLLTQRVD
jgi:hypothetical protein